MSNGKRGKRGGSNRRLTQHERERLHDIHSKIGGLPSGTHLGHTHSRHGTSTTARLVDAAKLFDCSVVEEHEDTHIVPRRSVTQQQGLERRRAPMETEAIHGKQIDRVTGAIVEVTDQRMTWRGDRTLLRRGNPFSNETHAARNFKREGSVSVGLDTRKTITPDQEIPVDGPDLGISAGGLTITDGPLIKYEPTE